MIWGILWGSGGVPGASGGSLKRSWGVPGGRSGGASGVTGGVPGHTGGCLGVPGRFKGVPLWSLGGPWGLFGGSPNRFVKYTRGNSDVSEGSLVARKNAKGRLRTSRRTSSGSIIPGVWAPPNLLAEAKSDENERRLRVRDLTRPGPKGPANYYYH